MDKLSNGMEAAINGFVTAATVMLCLPTLPFVHFQPSDLQRNLHGMHLMSPHKS